MFGELITARMSLLPGPLSRQSEDTYTLHTQIYACVYIHVYTRACA